MNWLLNKMVDEKELKNYLAHLKGPEEQYKLALEKVDAKANSSDAELKRKRKLRRKEFDPRKVEGDEALKQYAFKKYVEYMTAYEFIFTYRA